MWQWGSDVLTQSFLQVEGYISDASDGKWMAWDYDHSFPEVVATLYSERLSSSFFHSSVNPPLHTQGEVRQIRQGEGTRILAACVEKQVSPLENLQSKMEGLSFENVAACMILNPVVFWTVPTTDWWFNFPPSEQKEERKA